MPFKKKIIPCPLKNIPWCHKGADWLIAEFGAGGRLASSCLSLWLHPSFDSLAAELNVDLAGYQLNVWRETWLPPIVCGMISLGLLPIWNCSLWRNCRDPIKHDQLYISVLPIWHYMCCTTFECWSILSCILLKISLHAVHSAHWCQACYKRVRLACRCGKAFSIVTPCHRLAMSTCPRDRTRKVAPSGQSWQHTFAWSRPAHRLGNHPCSRVRTFVHSNGIH